MDELTTEYFANTNNLFKAFIEDISEVKKNYETTWDKLSIGKQALLINEFYNLEGNCFNNEESVDINETYDFEDFYNLLNVDSEKTLVSDFENDTSCWTWVDEHSAIFSWKSKSQENLRLTDLFIESENAIKSSKNKVKVVKTISAPQNKSINLKNDQTDFSSTNEIEMMFKRFGLKSNVSNETSLKNPISKMLHEKLVTRISSLPLDENLTQGKITDISVNEEDGNNKIFSEGLNQKQNNDDNSMNLINKELSGYIRTDNKNINFKNIDFKLTLNHDVGETSTDDSEQDVNLKSLYNKIENSFSALSNIPENEFEDVVNSQPKSEAMAIKKTGFDFLDNW